MNKKGSMKTKVVVGVLLTIISVIILVNFVQGTMGSYQSASDDLRSQPCEDAGGFWNTTSDGSCQVSASNSTALSYTDFSLGGLFARNTGIIPLVILAAALLVSVIAVFAFLKFRGN